MLLDKFTNLLSAMGYEGAGPKGQTSAAMPVSMAFLYRDSQTCEIARQGDVEVIDLPAQQVISVAVRGEYENGFVLGYERIQNWLAENPGRYEVAGPPRFLRYNSPFVPWFLRIG